MAYKVFSNGDALTGSELNTYLMNQAVISFATTTARDAALPSPSEGQLVWLEDSNKYVYYTGSAWSDLITPASSGNAIINGAFDIWQRGTSFSNPSSGAFTADRWAVTYDGTGATRTVSQQAFTPGSAPVAGYEGAYFLRHDLSAAGSGNTTSVFNYKIEDVRNFAAQTVTLSFWAKANATRNLTPYVIQNFGSGGSSSVNSGGSAISIGTSWARYSLTVALPSIAGKTIGSSSFIHVYLDMGAGGTFTFDIWGVQVEAGSTATAFKRNASNIQGELAACQRYYHKSYSQGTNPGTATATGACDMAVGTNTTGYLMIGVRFPVLMRTAPTVTTWDYAGGLNKVYKGGNNKTAYVAAIGDSGMQAGSSDATSANEVAFQYIAEAEL